MITEKQREAFNRFMDIITYHGEREIALLQTREKETKRDVVLIVQVREPTDKDENFYMNPLAELLIDGDIDRYEDPEGSAETEEGKE